MGARAIEYGGDMAGVHENVGKVLPAPWVDGGVGEGGGDGGDNIHMYSEQSLWLDGFCKVPSCYKKGKFRPTYMKACSSTN